MDIRIVSSGREFFGVDPLLAALLLELHPGNVERIGALPKPAQSSRRWTEYAVMHPNPFTLDFAIRILTGVGNANGVGSQVSFYGGDPDGAKAAMPDCPDSVIAEYRRLKSLKVGRVSRPEGR